MVRVGVRLRKIAKNCGYFPSDEARQQTAVFCLEEHRKGVEDAVYHPGASGQSIRNSVRRMIHLRHQLRSSTDLSTRNS